MDAHVQVHRSAIQTIPGDLTWEAISFDTELRDPRNWWRAAAPARVSVDITGMYAITVYVLWDQNATGRRLLQIRNPLAPDTASIVAALQAANASSIQNNSYPTQTLSALVYMEAGWYVQAQVAQDSDAGRNVEFCRLVASLVQRTG